MEDTKRERIAATVAKLRAHAASAETIGSEEEAATFAEHAAAMTIEHALTDAEIAASTEGEVVDPIVQVRVDLAAHGIRATSKRCAWAERLARSVGRSNLCLILVTSGRNAPIFMGTAKDVETSTLVWAHLVRTGERLSQRAYQDHRASDPWADTRAYRASWLNGYCDRLGARLKAARVNAIERANAAPQRALGISSKTSNPQTALMVVSGALERVEQHLKGLRLGNARGIGGGPTYDSGGYRAGQAAGGSVGMTGRRGIGA
jgi:hypothetical protein